VTQDVNGVERPSGVLWPPRPDSAVREVGHELITTGLGRATSLFDPTRRAWASEVVEDLYHRYNERPLEGSESFLVKLGRQLADAPEDSVLLMAELVTLQALPLLNMSQSKKRGRVNDVLESLKEPVRIPDRVMTAFGEGTWNGGIGAHTMLWKWLADTIIFLRQWWVLPVDQRRRALEDPWMLRDIQQSVGGMPSMQRTFLYLAFPSHFLPIINGDHTRHIRQAFIHRIKTTGDEDRDLLAITVGLQEELDRPVDYYTTPFVEQWKTGTDRVGRRAWLVRPRQGGEALVQRWLDEGFVSLSATHLGVVEPGSARDVVVESVERGYQHVDYAQRLALVTEYEGFLTRMSEDDVVATVVGDRLWVGVITGDPEYSDEKDARLRRKVEWSTAGSYGIDTLAAPLPSSLDQQGSVVDLTGAIAVLDALLGTGEVAGGEPAPEPTDVQAEVPRLREVSPDLARELHTDRAWLQELVDVLQDRQQVILYGPPGTGKTFIARHVARYLTEADAVQLVQFHPSYAYEDFFEGYRPMPGAEGSVSFQLQPGPLRQLAAEARENPGRPYVLIVDEINRANLAKVFGELYFLLEYRRDSIQLQYSPGKAFTLPPNVFLIGTMNTADRSIALVDTAIRRRFAFVELHPDEAPVRDLLRNWLQANGKDDERARLLDALNDAIGTEDRDFKIGPSYLMRQDAERDGGLARVWKYSILPLLEEHHYGRLTREQVHARFGLDAMRRVVVAATAGPDDGVITPVEAEDVGEPDLGEREA
jgi:5-methylcytosine-specific restriction enzyme B